MLTFKAPQYLDCKVLYISCPNYAKLNGFFNADKALVNFF